MRLALCSLSLLLPLLAASGEAPAQAVRQMADLNTGPNGFLTGGMGTEAKFVDGRTVFVANDRIHGFELWVTDGTAPNTRLLADICPGQCSSSPNNLHVEGNTLFFAANDGVHGSELWRLPSGSNVPVLVADINPGTEGSNPAEFVRRQFIIGGGVVTRSFFVATRRAEGRELWRLSATTPTLERDIAPGAASSDPRTLVLLANGSLAITAQTPNLGRELYALGYNTSADPAAVSSTPIGGFNINANRSLRTDVVTIGPRVYAVVDDRTTFDDDLYVTDGTTAGTLKLRQADLIGTLVVNATLAKPFYTVRNGGTETLGTSDGTVAGTVSLGTTNIAPKALTVLGGRVFFTGLTGSSGRELFSSDGTVAGTGLFKELVPGTAGIPDDALGRTSANNLRAWFGFGIDLWITDGTAANTIEVSGSTLSGANGKVRALVPTTGQNTILSFDPDGNLSGEPFFSTGILGGTVSLGTTIPDIGDSFPTPVGVVGGRLVFGASVPGGSTNTFSLPVAQASAPLALESTSVSTGGVRFGRLWMRSAAGLKATDGTAAPMTVLTPSRPEMFSEDCVVMRNGLAHVLAIDDSDNTTQVYQSDGTVAGTVRATNVPNEPNIGIVDFCIPGFRGLAGAGDLIYMVGQLPSAPTAGFELLKLDANNQLSLVIDLRAGPESPQIRDMQPLGNRLLFVANDGIFGEELWSTTGTAQGTVRLTDLTPGVTGSNITNLTRVGNRVYFIGRSATQGLEWFVTDGTPAGTTLVADLFSGIGSGADPGTAKTAVVDNTLFFTGTSTTDPTCRLFRTEGTAASTRCAYNPAVSVLGPVQKLAATAGGAVVLSAWSAADGEELRVIGNGQVVTLPGLDVQPGPLGSAPSDLVVSGENVFFRANDGSTGFELWQLTVPDLNRLFGDSFE